MCIFVVASLHTQVFSDKDCDFRPQWILKNPKDEAIAPLAINNAETRRCCTILLEASTPSVLFWYDADFKTAGLMTKRRGIGQTSIQVYFKVVWKNEAENTSWKGKKIHCFTYFFRLHLNLPTAKHWLLPAASLVTLNAHQTVRLHASPCRLPFFRYLPFLLLARARLPDAFSLTILLCWRCTQTCFLSH